MVNRIIYGIDYLSRTVGHAFAWCIVILTLGTSYDVLVRYVLNDPTSWAFDLSYILYGALFLMSGAYTLSRNGHVRGDFLFVEVAIGLRNQVHAQSRGSFLGARGGRAGGA